VAVVMVDVDAEHLLELSPADDQDPVEAVAADGADPALGERVCLRRPEWCADDLDALASEDLVEGAAELAVPIMDQVRTGVSRAESDPADWRACRATHAPLGLAVQPARCTRLLPSSMKKST
jgi:hypothetical protein